MNCRLAADGVCLPTEVMGVMEVNGVKESASTSRGLSDVVMWDNVAGISPLLLSNNLCSEKLDIDWIY